METHDFHTHATPAVPTRSKLSAALLIAIASMTKPAEAQPDLLAADDGITDVILVTADPNRILPNAPSESSFGFNKSLLETPRAVSIVSEETIDLFGFLTTEPNAEVAAVHPRAMPVILTAPEEIETWMTAPWETARALQRPLPDGSLAIVARGTKRDGG